jgi:hypothetical protein
VSSSTVALAAFVSWTKNVSSGSIWVSPLTETLTCFVFSPGSKVSVPPALE